MVASRHKLIVTKQYATGEWQQQQPIEHDGHQQRGTASQSQDQPPAPLARQPNSAWMPLAMSVQYGPE
jgi:hypothetical protein